MKREMKYKAWLVYDREGAGRNADYIRMHQETGARMGIEVTLVVTEQIRDFSLYTQEDKPDFAIVRTIQPALSKQLEGFGIPVFNNSFVSEICNHKGKTLDYIRANSDIPVIPSETFSHLHLSQNLLSQYPEHVIKAVDGHGGSQVFRTGEPWEVIRRGITDSDFVIQPFIDGPGQDIRLYVIGSQIVGAVERQSADGFRANYSLGGKVRSIAWGKREEQLVQSVCRLFSFGLVGIDFIVDKRGEWLLSEIEDVVGARMLYQCQPDINLPEQYFAFIRDRIGG